MINEPVRRPRWPARTTLALALGLAVALSLALLSARPAHATMTKGACTAVARGTLSGDHQGGQAEWHLNREEEVTGEGHPPRNTELKGVAVRVHLFGFPIPVYGNGDTGKGGTAGPFKVRQYTGIARIVVVSGEAGEGPACAGTVKIILDDVNPVATVVGGGGGALGVLGLLGILAAAFGRGGAGGRVGGALAGLVSGIGFGLLLQQTGTLDPTNAAGLALPAAGLIVGAAAAGAFGRGGARARA